MYKFSFFIGIDVSKAVIDVSYWHGGQAIYIGQYSNCKSGFKSVIKSLSKVTEISLEEWFVCFENTGSYSKALLNWLTDQSISCLEENPMRINKSLGLRRGKNDKADSKDICKYAFEKKDTIEPSILNNPLIIKLKAVLSRRDLLVKHRTALKVTLKEQKSSMDKDLYKDLNVQNKLMISYYDKRIKGLEEMMEQIIESDPAMAKNNSLLQSIIGIAQITAAYLIATTNNFKSFSNSRKYACYCGIAPFANSSGIKNGKPRVNPMANKKIKSLLSNCILSAIIHDREISKYYKRKKAEGKPYGVIANAIKNKIIHRAFAVIDRQSPYVERLTYA